jgi:hypothetical protein
MTIARFEMPDGRIARFDVPAGTSPEEAQRMISEMLGFETPAEPPKAKEAPTIGGQFKEFAKGVIPGAIGMVESAGTGISALLPDQQELIARNKIRSLAAAAREPFTAAPGYEETVGRKLGESVGSIGPFLALGPLGAAGRLGMAGLGVGAGAGEARVRAEQEGATADQRSLATALGSVVGATEMFAPARILNRLSAPVQAGAAAAVRRALLAGGEEAAQEAAAQIAQNLIAKGIYKPDQAIIEQVGESAAYGGATGALVQGLLDLAIGRRAKPVTPPGPVAGQQPAEQAAQSGEQPPEVVPGTEAIPEPTLRQPAPTPEQMAPGVAKAARGEAARARKLEKEQQEYLKRYALMQAQREKDTAEYERIKAMTPEEYALEQAQEVPATRKGPRGAMPEPVGIQPIAPYSEAQQFAATQIKLAQDREPYADVGSYVDYILAKPEMARALVAAGLPIPGLTPAQSQRVLNSLESTLTLQDKAAAKEAKIAGSQATLAAQQRLGQVEGEEQAALEAQRAEADRLAREAEQADQDARRAQRIQPEVEGIRRLGRVPEDSFSEANRIAAEERLAKRDHEEAVVEALVGTLPRETGKIMPGTLYRGLGGKKASIDDLRAQLKIALATKDKATAQNLIRELRSKEDIGTDLTADAGQATAELQGLLGTKPADTTAQEKKAVSYADTQRMLMVELARVKALAGRIGLPETQRERVSGIKEQFAEAHANEINARRAMFGLPEMADWERGEARARAMEALNTLDNNWGQFNNPVTSVRQLQRIVRKSTFDNVLDAAQRFNLAEAAKTEQKNEPRRGQQFFFEDEEGKRIEGKTMETPRETGPRIAAPAELALRGAPRRAAEDKQDALDLIEQALSTADRRTRAAPAVGEKAPAKVGSLAEMARLFEQDKTSGNAAKMDQASIDLLERLREALPGSTDPEFAKLAREQAQQVLEGNLPNPFAVRDLDEMMRAQEAAGRSAAPALSAAETERVARGEAKFEAQPQRELFGDMPQTVRDTVRNFQKLLESGQVQKLREDIEKRRQNNIDALQRLSRELPTATNKLRKAKAHYTSKLKTAQKSGTVLHNFKQEFEEDLAAINQTVQALQAARDSAAIAVQDIEAIRTFLLSEPADMRTLINASNALKQEPALRAKLKQAEKELAIGKELEAAIRATIAADDTLVKPLQKRMAAANKDLFSAQEDLAEANRALQAEKQQAAAAEAAEKARAAKAEEEAAVTDQTKPTPEPVWRGALQAGREGLNLPGVRLEKDTSNLKQQIAEIRSAMGSLDEQIDNETDATRKAELQAKLDEQKQKLDTVYANAPVIKTELLTRKAEKEAREFDEAQAAAYDAASARRRKRKGEKAPKLQPVARVGAYRDVRTNQIVQPLKPTPMVEPAAVTTNKLIKARSDLAEVQRRMNFLKDNGTNKKNGRLTDVYKKLQEEEKKLKESVAKLTAKQSETAATERAAVFETPRQQARREAEAVERESQRFARGVEVASPDLTPDQVQALENNKLTSVLFDIAEDPNADKLNRAVAKRLATMLSGTDVIVQNRLYDNAGGEVLGSAISTKIELSRNGGLSQEVLLHEGTHAVTERVIKLYKNNPDKLTETQRAAVRELIDIHNAIKDDPSITSASAKGSLSEFAAEVFSNKKLQEQLRAKPWRLTDMLRAIKSIVLRLVGFTNAETETMLGASITAIDALMVPSSAKNLGRETKRSRKMSAKDIAALHTGSNSMKQFADQFGDRIKQKDRTPEDVERIASDIVYEMGQDLDKLLSVPTADSLNYTALATMSDGKIYDNDNPLHYLEAEPATHAAVKAMEDPALRKREAREIAKQRKEDFTNLAQYFSDNYTNYTVAEMALVLKAASKYAVLSGKDGRLRLAEIANNNRHNIAVVGKDGADAVIEELRRGKNLKTAFLDGLQKAADNNAKKNERFNGWKKFDQAKPGQASLAGLYTNEEIEDAFGQTGYDPGYFEDETALIETLIADGFLPDRRNLLGADSVEQAAINLNAGCAGTSWCTGASVNTARGQIEQGDFYVYYKDGKPDVAVRMSGKDRIGEIRGNTPNQALTKEQQQTAESFLLANDFKGADKYINETARKALLIKLFSDPNFNDYKALVSFGEFVRNGQLRDYRVRDLLDFSAFGGYGLGRPSDAVYEALKKRLKVVVRKAYETNNFVGQDIRFKDDGSSNDVEFDGKKYPVDLATIESAGDITFDYNTDALYVAPNLRSVKDMNVSAGKVVAPNLTDIKELTLFATRYNSVDVTVSPNAVIKTIDPYSSYGKMVVRGARTVNEVIEPTGTAKLSLPDAKYVYVALKQGDKLLEISTSKLTDYMRNKIRDADDNAGFGIVREPMTALSLEAKRAFKKSMRDIAAVLDMRNFNIESEPYYDDDGSPKTLLEKFLYEYAGDYVRADMLAFNKKANEALGLTGVEALIDQTGTVDTPSKIADTEPVQALTETDEEPVYARAQATGMDRALDTASQLIASKKTVRERINANLGLSFRTQALDRLAPLEKIAYEMMDPLKGLQMMTYLRFADQKMSFVQGSVGIGAPQLVKYERADGRDEYIVENVPGPSLSSVVMKLRDTPNMNAEAANQLFTLYLAGKRGERVGYGKLNFKMPADQIKAAVNQIEANAEVRKVFEEARELYNSYNRDLMKFLESTGALSPQEAKRLSDTNDYIPFYREENGYAVLVVGGEGTFRIGNLKDQPQLRELIGGEQKILDFMTSSVQNTSMIMDIGLRNLATKNAMVELQDLGLARFLESDTSGPDIVTFKDKGVTKYVRVETDKTGIPPQLLVKGMEGIPVNNSALVRALGYAAAGVRKGVMLNPLYPVKQLFRDSVAAPMVSGADFVPVLGALKQIGNSATKHKLEARGVTGGQVFTGTNEDLSRILKDMQAGKIGLGQVVAKAEAIAMEADALTRRAQYDSYIKQGFSEMEATLMSLESMNFNRKGLSPSARFLATTIPFFNAQVQSLDALYRSLRGKMPMSDRLNIQGKLIRRGALLAATSVAYALLMQDDDAYKNATPEQKYNNFFVRLPGLDEPLRFPVPFEIGYLFKSLPEAIVNLMAGGPKAERDALVAFRGIAMQTVPGGTSLFLPAALKPIVENVANYSFFTQGQLEGKREQSLLPEYRYRDTTSELAKGLGMATGTSPIKIENLIRGYLGPAGMALVQSFDFAMPKAGGVEQATKRLSETPVIGTLFQPNDAKGIINDVYDRVTEINQIKSTYTDLLAEGKGAEARAFLQQHVNEYAQAAVAGNFRTQMETLTKAETAVKASAYSAEKKREMLDRLRELKIRMATNVSGVFDKTTPR